MIKHVCIGDGGCGKHNLDRVLTDEGSDKMGVCGLDKG